MGVLVVYFETNTMDLDEEAFYAKFLDSSSADDDEDEDQIVMMRVILEKMEHAEKHVTNFKGSTKGHKVLNRNRA